jgi:hypothetical protein
MGRSGGGEAKWAFLRKRTSPLGDEDKSGLLTISKLDAAKRQLETVIRLYFSNGDPVAIHTLTAAAYNVLRDVTSRRGAEPMLVKDKMLDSLKSQHKQAIIQKINEAENFFKHAHRDHESTLDFNPDASEFLLVDACSQYEKLTGEVPPLFIVYRTWFMASRPDLFKFDEERKRFLRAEGPSIVKMGRAHYFSTMLPEAMSIK